MAIVDCFTHLIFDVEAELSDQERLLVDLLAHVDASLAGADRVELSDYLRNMETDEMIDTVAELKRLLVDGPLTSPPGHGRGHHRFH